MSDSKRDKRGRKKILTDDQEEKALSLMCQGKPNKAVAAELGISVSSVDKALKRLKKKYGAVSNMHLAAIFTKSAEITN